KFTDSERDDLRRMLEYLPELATLRRFADRICGLFDVSKDFHQAACRRAALVRDPAFRAVPELVKAMEQLAGAKIPKMMAYLSSPANRRVRTNNHVERTNRMIRFLEKVRYKWRFSTVCRLFGSPDPKLAERPQVVGEHRQCYLSVSPLWSLARELL